MSKFQAGDIIQYPNGRQNYLIAIPGQDGLWVNACNPSWIDRGLRSFCEECYPFGGSEDEAAQVVGHYGDGDGISAQEWYERNRERYLPDSSRESRSLGDECADMRHSADRLEGQGGGKAPTRDTAFGDR